MLFRTDLALETREILNEDLDGIEQLEKEIDGMKVTKITVKNRQAADYLRKPIGEYINVEVPDLNEDMRNMQGRVKIIADEIGNLLPKRGLILVAGLGNSDITPDALGPRTADMVLATRHIKNQLENTIELEGLRSVAVLAPGVLGQTGIETMEILVSLVKKIKPDGIVLVDALASRSVQRLGRTLQISNTGISPGSGVGNARPLIDRHSMGVPVVSIGVPTVVDAVTLAADLLNFSDDRQLEDIAEKVSSGGQDMMVTPREIDVLIERVAKLTGMAINYALHPNFNLEDLSALVT